MPSSMQKGAVKTEIPDWILPMKLTMASLHHGQVQACSITRVRDKLRKPNEPAFTPKEVSIGPLHGRNRMLLLLMEETKWHYMHKFLNRTNQTPPEQSSSLSRLENCGKRITEMNKLLIASYGGNIESESSEEFGKMMIVDGCFLLELLMKLGTYRRNQTSDHSGDPVLGNEKKLVSILSDITMLENQIPFIVLKKLYREVFPDDDDEIYDDNRVASIVKTAFNCPNEDVDISRCAHILHFMHLSTVQTGTTDHTSTVQPDNSRPAKQELLRCATRLHAAGIIITAGNTGTTATDQKLVDWFNFNISFSDSNSELQIPALKIKETTEVMWRNLIAWEQSMIGIKCKYTSYGLFFQGLVCCKHDIDLLKEKHVIINEAGKSNQELLNLFSTISVGAEYMDSSYEETCKNLNEYGRPLGTIRGLPIVTWHNCRHVSEIIMYYWGNWYEILIRDQIPTVWKLIGVLAAVALLILTIMQTYYSSKSS